MFNELDAAESRCAAIRKEIETYYLKTCEVYDDEHQLSVPGVGCQTETTEFESSLENEQKSDLKLKIALVSKRKRGRPVKAQPRKRVPVENIQVSVHFCIDTAGHAVALAYFKRNYKFGFFVWNLKSL